MISGSKIYDVYDVIEQSRKRYGTLKKCEFHLHTPASYDYKLLEKFTPEQYRMMSDSEVILLATDEGLISDEMKDIMLQDIERYTGNEYVQVIQEQGKPFANLKEYLSYSMIAHRLVKEEVEVVVIADHNTISGYHKLKYALFEYYEQRRENLSKALDLLLGVEISCSEKNHVIAIFDEKNFGVLNNYLNEILLNEEGTYLSSHQVLSGIIERGGIGYIAHVDTSDLLGSGVYNQTLFGLKEFNILGFSDISKKDIVLKSRIKQYYCKAESKFCCIAEGDSHSLDTIGRKNLWVKFGKANFSSLEKAFIDHNISIYNEKPQKSDKFIKGIVVSPGKFGFLKTSPDILKDITGGTDENDFVVDFSRDLNCIIGGRGTGKSTTLNIIETVFTLDTTNKDNLKFISRHESIYIVFCCEGIDYILHFLPQVYAINDSDEEIRFLSRAFDNNKLSKNWIELYRVCEHGIEKMGQDESLDILFKKIYRRGYSINNLVAKIENGSIGDFIKDTIMYGVNYQKMQKFKEELDRLHYAGRYKQYLKENLGSMIESFKEQASCVNDNVESFNQAYKYSLRVEYAPRIKDVDDYMKDLLSAVRGEGYVAKTILTWDEVEYFLRNACDIMGFLEFLNCLFNRQYSKIESYIKIEDCIDKDRVKTFGQVNIGLEDVTKKNIKLIYQAIYGRVVDNKAQLIRSIQNWLERADDFSLSFNINHREAVQSTKPLFKILNELSTGQKVSALLAFVLNFGEHVGDNTPLIIDQPENDLDNQYIFKNLVDSLRRVKNKRQVIIVTHSSTLVTNADAEQVIVMESDNDNGWVNSLGYPRSPAIVKHIVNYLEGGVLSFKNKMDTYRLFIKELNE